MRPVHAMNRARGAMLGMAVGDALGAPLEGLGPQQIRAHYSVVEDYVDGALQMPVMRCVMTSVMVSVAVGLSSE